MILVIAILNFDYFLAFSLVCRIRLFLKDHNQKCQIKVRKRFRNVRGFFRDLTRNLTLVPHRLMFVMVIPIHEIDANEASCANNSNSIKFMLF